MATTTKRGSKTTKTKQRRPKLKTSVAAQAQTNAELRQRLAESLRRESATASENERLSNALKEALEHQTATSEVLSIISRSPTAGLSLIPTNSTASMKLSSINITARKIAGDVDAVEAGKLGH
jgi:hypothetical protein